jgi:hypothetical protein
MKDPYAAAQKAIAQLKGSIHDTLKNSPTGLKNAQIGQILGIHRGHGNQHAGHITRTLLETMQSEGTVKQSAEKLWSICEQTSDEIEFEPKGDLDADDALPYLM